jgi:anti-anti-sigma regulatory factor
MNLQIEADRAHRTLTVAFSGTLDRRTAHELPDALDAADAASFETVRLDLSGCVVGDRSAVDALVRVNRSMNAAGIRLLLMGARPPLQCSADESIDDAADRMMTAS